MVAHSHAGSVLPRQLDRRMTPPGTGDANTVSGRPGVRQGDRLAFYRRHIPHAHRSLRATDAALTGWAQLIDFGGALRLPAIRVPFLAADDDVDALLFDRECVGEDNWVGLMAVVGSLPREDLDRVRDELVPLL